MLLTQNSPPLVAPLRFFLTAPLFGMLMGVVLMYYPDAVFISRWLPETLALVHLCTLGVMLQMMLGALIQILPVLAGAVLPKVQQISVLTHGFLTLGTLSFVGAFLNQSTGLMWGALVLMTCAAVIFFGAVFVAFFRHSAHSSAILGLKLATAALLVTLILGFILLGTQALGIYLSKSLTNLHAIWGLMGWSSILLMSVAFVVVPMFQLTPNYPPKVEQYLPLFLIIFLILLSFSTFLNLHYLNHFFILFLMALLFLFCILSLKLQKKRRRARRDPTFYAWEIALFFSALSILCLIFNQLFPEQLEKYHVVSNALMMIIYSFFGFIIGMLFKILPFLSWLHLQNASSGKYKIPAMNYYLTEKEAYFHLFFYLLSFLFLILSIFFPLFRISNGILIALQFFILEIILMASFYRYQKVLKHLRNEQCNFPR